jgi:hypothetical protein
LVSFVSITLKSGAPAAAPPPPPESLELLLQPAMMAKATTAAHPIVPILTMSSSIRVVRLVPSNPDEAGNKPLMAAKLRQVVPRPPLRFECARCAAL